MIRPARPPAPRHADRAGGHAPFPTGVVPVEPTHYQRLGVAEDCTGAELAIAWHRATSAGQTAPDLRLAHAVLADAARRAVYDRWLADERGASERQPWIRRLLRRRG